MERKLAAILAADIAGYTRLMGTDEEGTHAALRSHREAADQLIAAHHGRVFGSAGDSVVAEFASAVEAIQAAVDIQRDIARRNETVPVNKQLCFRMGLNIGDVMVEGNNLFGAVSMSLHACRRWPSPAAFAFRATSTTKSKTKSHLLSKTSANIGSRMLSNL
jgi:class 3 adenylate cyclase